MIVESDLSSTLTIDDEPINNELNDEIQSQEVSALLDSPCPLSTQPWSMRIEPLPDLETKPLRPSIQAPP